MRTLATGYLHTFYIVLVAVIKSLLFQPSYWCGTTKNRRIRGAEPSSTRGGFTEEEPRGLEAGIQIRNLTKQFKGAAKVDINSSHCWARVRYTVVLVTR